MSRPTIVPLVIIYCILNHTEIETRFYCVKPSEISILKPTQ